MRLDCGISLQQEVGWDRQTIRTTRFLADSQNEPFLVYSEAVLVQQIRNWRRLFPRIQPTHDVTLNGLGRVLEALHNQGVRLDVTCKSQINTLADLALLTKREGVMYTAPHKVASHLRAAEEGGVCYMVYSAKEELVKIKKACPNARLLLLLDCQTTPNLVEIKQLLVAGQEAGLPVCGLYLSELASQGSEDLPVLATWLRLARSLHAWAADNLGLRLERLHIGELAGMASSASGRGGDNCCDCASELNQLVDTLFPAHLQVVISAAATRFLVSPAVTLATRVVAVRDRTAIGGACNLGPEMFYYINEGVFGAFSGILFENNNNSGASSNLVPFPLGGVKNRKGAASHVAGHRYFGTSIRGPSGDELDVIADEVLLPRLDEDDWLLFPGLGCLNDTGYGRSSCIDGSANYIYRKGDDAAAIAAADGFGGDLSDVKMAAASGSLLPFCDGFSVDLDTFQRFAFSQDGERPDIDLKNTFLYDD